METTAVYFESRIRTYGFHLDRGLSLLEIRAGLKGPGLWDQGPESLGVTGLRFNLVFAQILEDHGFCVYVALEGSSASQIIDSLNCRLVASPVDILSFQGPHYKDRYGIALEALKSLRSRDISPTAFCCSVSCIYIVLEGGKGDAAHDILMEKFEVPPKNSRRKRASKKDGV